MIGTFNTIMNEGDTLHMRSVFSSIVDNLTGIQQIKIYIDSEYMYNCGHLSLYVGTDLPLFSLGKMRYDYASLDAERGVSMLRKNINSNLQGAPLEVVDRLTKSMRTDDPYEASEELFSAMKIIIGRQRDEENKKYSLRLFFLQKLVVEFKKRYSDFVSASLILVNDNSSVGALKKIENMSDDECETCKI